MNTLHRSIIVVGKICSGKTTLAKNISEHLQMPMASFGKYLVDYCFKHKIPTDRDSLQNIGEELVRKDHDSFLDEVISFNVDSMQSLIFEGVRHQSIFEGIVKRSQKSFSIYIDISIEERYSRYIKRHGTIVSFDDFIRINNHPVEKEVDALKPLCNLVLNADDLGKAIVNNISFE